MLTLSKFSCCFLHLKTEVLREKGIVQGPKTHAQRSQAFNICLFNFIVFTLHHEVA